MGYNKSRAGLPPSGLNKANHRSLADIQNQVLSAKSPSNKENNVNLPPISSRVPANARAKAGHLSRMDSGLRQNGQAIMGSMPNLHPIRSGSRGSIDG